jgi:hypothetical protein
MRLRAIVTPSKLKLFDRNIEFANVATGVNIKPRHAVAYISMSVYLIARDQAERGDKY